MRRYWIWVPLLVVWPLILAAFPIAWPGAVPTAVARPAPPGYVCVRTAAAPAIDGALNDACWATAAWSADFVDIEGRAKPAPQHRTRLKMLWDDAGLYLGAELTEPNVWGTITQHDAVIFNDNDFEIFLDPDGDNHNYAEIELNALNTTWDLLLSAPYRSNGLAVNDWEAIGWRSAVGVQGTRNDSRDVDTGWTVEAFWPWASIRQLAPQIVPPVPGTCYRMNFSRVQWDVETSTGRTVKIPDRPEHNWVWAPTGVVDIHRPHRWGYVQFALDATATYAPNPEQPILDDLSAVLEMQNDLHIANKPYAKSFGELGRNLTSPGATIEASPSGWVMSIPHVDVTHRVNQTGRMIRDHKGAD